jgi:hypothetical protein
VQRCRGPTVVLVPASRRSLSGSPVNMDSAVECAADGRMTAMCRAVNVTFVSGLDMGAPETGVVALVKDGYGFIRHARCHGDSTVSVAVTRWWRLPQHFFTFLSVRAAERPARVFFHFSEMLDGGAPAAGDEVQFYSIRMLAPSFASRACGWRHKIMAMQRSRAATTRSARCGSAGCPRDRSNLTYAVCMYIGPMAPYAQEALLVIAFVVKA